MEYTAETWTVDLHAGVLPGQAGVGRVFEEVLEAQRCVVAEMVVQPGADLIAEIEFGVEST